MLTSKIVQATNTLRKWQEMSLLVTRQHEYQKLLDEVVVTAALGEKWLKIFETLNQFDPIAFQKQDWNQTIVQLESIVQKLGNVSEVPKAQVYKKIQEAITQKDEHLKKIWKAYVQEKSKAQRGMIDALVGIIGESEADIRIACLTAIEDNWPVNQNTLNRFEALRTEIDELTTGLNIDTEIQSFLANLRMKQIRLSDITPSIMEWLEKQDMKKKITLTFGD